MAQPITRHPLDENWQILANDTTDFKPLSTNIPMTIQQALLEAELIPDPYYGIHENDVQWVGEQSWTFVKNFTASPASAQHHRLLFEGLDTYAEVLLNGESILTADNMFRRWSVDVSDKLKQGDNELRIIFTSPASNVLETINNFPYPLNNTSANDTGTPRMANFTRKAQFHFGWDWGLRLLTQGIWRPVFLESWNDIRIEDIQYFQEELTDNVARMRTRVRLTRDAASNKNYELRIRGVANGQLYAKRQLLADETELDVNFQIDQPIRWWPVGHGDPHRYHLICELWQDGQLLDSREHKIGLRTVEKVQQEDEYGVSYYFRINGRPIFTKGASYIPQDAMLTRITPLQKTQLLTSARDAHCNLIRIWGGGIYEDQHFYETCDSLGLMVWQDFMFACAAYPSFPEFQANVRAEAVDNIRRLRNHPSIIQWCGNNEVFLAMKNWGWQDEHGIKGKDEKAMFASYEDIFLNLLPLVLKEEDPGRGFQFTHTTPLKSYAEPGGLSNGTLHYWGVWHGPDDFSGYETKVGRYMNEYGFQSFPNMETIAQFADSSQWDLNSPVMDHHQKSYVGNGLIGKFTEQYGEPTDDFAGFVEQSQRVHAEGMRRAIVAHRMRWGYCMGTTFWQLNDCWPGPSWSAIDYYGRPKVLFQELPNFYAPVIAAAVGDPKAPQLAIISDFPGGDEIQLLWERKNNATDEVQASGSRKVTILHPGTQLLAPAEDMVPTEAETTYVHLKDRQGEHISTFTWSGRQVPILLPEDENWVNYYKLAK